jgi:hypothetical protein
MAQADSTPTPVHDPFTGADTDPSTNNARQTFPPVDRDGPGLTRLAHPGCRSTDRRYFIGGSEARIIMGSDEAALIRLWREKRGEVEARGPLEESHRPARSCH